ncbi:MAG: TlpA family protein disulfide reductase [Mucilaginibacter sp.]|nr:TlpA family protein disulfide reductase [Mucilaginibacter sp.]
MKKSTLAILLLLASICSYAQTPSAGRATLNEQSVVRDSAGVQLSMAAWQLLARTGNYWMKVANPGQANPEFILLKLTDQQKAERLSRMDKPAESKFFTTGGIVEPFKVRDIYGNKVDKKEWAGKTVVLNFWFIGCPPCRAEIPDLNKLALKYKDNPNVLFIAIALDEDYNIKDFVKDHPLNYRLAGSGQVFANQFKINLYPTNVVIDKAGKVLFHYVGGATNGPYWLDKSIQESEKASL